MGFFFRRACILVPQSVIGAIREFSHRLIDTLKLPFLEEQVVLPGIRGGGFVMRACDPLEWLPGWRENLLAEQTLRSEYSSLLRADVSVVERLEGTFDIGMVILTKHRKENYGSIARAWQMIAPGGSLVCVGENRFGVKSMEKNIGKVFPVEGRVTKNHCRAFWMKRNAIESPGDWLQYSVPGRHIADCPYVTQPGMFSWEKIDRGSAFLVEHLPGKIRGRVADLGAGWGYLSDRILARFEEVERIDLFENEKLALDCARGNLADFDRAQFHWTDLVVDSPERGKYDWVVMNPPFHTSARTDVSLGCHFIACAAQALRTNGSLVMVANRKLPYESELKKHFQQIDRLAESADFKVLRGRRPADRTDRP